MTRAEHGHAAAAAYHAWQRGRIMPWLTESELNELAVIDGGAYKAYCLQAGLNPDAPNDPDWQEDE